MDRHLAIDALRTELRRQLDAAVAAVRSASDEATGDQSKAEGKYDTRSTEASYLARGQAARVGALRSVVGWIETLGARGSEVVGVGSLVELEDERGSRHFFMAPGGGGTRVQVEGGRLVVVSPTAPLGAALMGLREGDSLSLPTGHEAEIVAVC